MSTAFKLEKCTNKAIKALSIDQLKAICRSEGISYNASSSREELSNLLISEKKKRKYGDKDDNPKATKIVRTISIYINQ
jgi:hypothetical protein